MSELTPCCFCVLRSMRRHAAKSGKVVTTLPGLTEVCGTFGTDVLVHEAGEEPDREKHFRAWLMEVSDSCVC